MRDVEMIKTIKTIKTIAENEWLSLRTIHFSHLGEDTVYTYVHENRCHGQIVGILPFRRDSNGDISFLLRSEVTPPWGPEPVISSITGGLEHGIKPAGVAVIELKEEAGFIVTEGELIPLGACRGVKCADTVYHLFAVDVTEKERHHASGDGSKLESLAQCFWSKNVHDAVDPLVYVMVYRLAHLFDNEG